MPLAEKYKKMLIFILLVFIGLAHATTTIWEDDAVGCKICSRKYGQRCTPVLLSCNCIMCEACQFNIKNMCCTSCKKKFEYPDSIQMFKCKSNDLYNKEVFNFFAIHKNEINGDYDRNIASFNTFDERDKQRREEYIRDYYRKCTVLLDMIDEIHVYLGKLKDIMNGNTDLEFIKECGVMRDDTGTNPVISESISAISITDEPAAPSRYPSRYEPAAPSRYPSRYEPAAPSRYEPVLKKPTLERNITHPPEEEIRYEPYRPRVPETSSNAGTSTNIIAKAPVDTFRYTEYASLRPSVPVKETAAVTNELATIENAPDSWDILSAFKKPIEKKSTEGKPQTESSVRMGAKPCSSGIEFNFAYPHLRYDANSILLSAYRDSNYNVVLRSYEFRTEISKKVKTLDLRLKDFSFVSFPSLHAIYIIGGEVVSNIARVSNTPFTKRPLSREIHTCDQSGTVSPIIKTLKHQRSNCAAVLFKNKIYIAGGVDMDGKVMNSVEVFDPNNTIEEIKPLNHPRCDFILIVFGNILFAIGGFDGRNYVNEVEIYDEQQKVWVDYITLKYPSRCAAAAVFGKCIFISGGCDENGFLLRDVMCWDPLVKDSEKYTTPTPIFRKNHILATAEENNADKKLILIYGYGEDDNLILGIEDCFTPLPLKSACGNEWYIRTYCINE